MEVADSTLVFVYGSLKQGFRLHHLLEDSRYCGKATTQPHYRIYNLGSYPGLIDAPTGLSITGEVYDVDGATLRRLDQAEGVDEGYYARRAIQLTPPFDGSTVQAWFWPGTVQGLVDCGHSWP